jgi:hypothetical protein
MRTQGQHARPEVRLQRPLVPPDERTKRQIREPLPCPSHNQSLVLDHDLVSSSREVEQG